MTYPQQPGTYCFHNTVNNKVYVGSAHCLNTRLNNHFKNQNSRPILQDAIKKHNLNAFNITCVITETYTEALMQEQLMLDYLFQNNIPKYNIAPIAGGGKTLTDYSNHAKISKRKMSDKEHQKLSETNGGCKAKVFYALEVNSPAKIYKIDSGYKAAKFANVPRQNITYSCKKGKPIKGNGRWLFSDISLDDLKTKFNNLKPRDICGRQLRN